MDSLKAFIDERKSEASVPILEGGLVKTTKGGPPIGIVSGRDLEKIKNERKFDET